MSGSVESAVAAATGLQSFVSSQDVQNTLLRQTLDSQAAVITNLIQDAVQGVEAARTPQLATSGSVGTQLHTTA